MKENKFKELVKELKQNMILRENICKKYPHISAINDFELSDFNEYRRLDKEWSKIKDELIDLDYFEPVKKELLRKLPKFYFDTLMNTYENILFEYEQKTGDLDLKFLLPILNKKIKNSDFTFLWLQTLIHYKKYYPKLKEYFKKVKSTYNDDVSFRLLFEIIEARKSGKNSKLIHDFWSEFLSFRAAIANNKIDPENAKFEIERAEKWIFQKKFSKLLDFTLGIEKSKKVKQKIIELANKNNISIKNSKF